MLLTNIILAIALFGFAGTGMKDGFIQTMGRLVGAVIGFIAAKAWYLKLSPVFAIIMPKGWADFIAFFIIFALITRLCGWAMKLVDGAYNILAIIPFVKSINSLLGFIVGFFEGLLIVGGCIYLIETFNLIPAAVALLTSSFVAVWILKAFTLLLGILL